LGRPRRIWEDNNIDLMAVGFEDGRWLKLAQDHVE
jgi:hypothetical protein